MEVQGLWNASDFRAVMAAILMVVALIANIPVVFIIGRYVRGLQETIKIIQCPDCGTYELFEASLADRLQLQVGDKLLYQCEDCNSFWRVVEVKKYDKRGQQLYG